MASKRNAEVSETKGGDGSVMEKRVETVDHQSAPAAQGQVERTRDVEVVHQYHPSEAGASTGGVAGGVVAEAAASVAHSIQSAKDAISGKTNESSN